MTLNEVLTLAVLFVQACLIAGQLYVYNEQRKLMANQLRVSTADAERARTHDRLSVRPLLDFDSDGDRRHLSVVLENHGSGVAVSVVMDVLVNGKSVPTNTNAEWPLPLLRALGLTDADLDLKKIQRGYVTMPAGTLRAGGKLQIIDFHFSGRMDVNALCKKMRITAAYQSLYGDEDGTFRTEIDWAKFRQGAIADSGRCRPLIPEYAGPVFRAMSGHHSGACRHRV